MAPAVTRVLIPLDLGEASTRTLEYGRTIARAFRASLLVLHVVPNPYVTAASDVYMPPPQEFLDELERDAGQRLNEFLTDQDRKEFAAEAVVRVGDPGREIVACAQQQSADLIVMGTHGRTGMVHLLLGSVAERVVRTASCPVLTMR